MFDIDDRVIVNTDKVCGQPWNGFIGDVVEIREFGELVLNDARNDDGELCRCRPLAVVQSEWCHLYTPPAIDEHPHDFSHSGLGIGGINNDQSMPEIPSAKAFERVQKMVDTDVICRRCGASKNFDGAMFTNGGGDICDDCF